MKAMDLKRMLGIILIFIVIMFVLMLTSSYAWYSFNEASTSFDVVTNNDEISIVYHTGMYIDTSSAVPINESQIGKFSEKNRFSIEINDKSLENAIAINVDLINISMDDVLKDVNFKYELLLDGVSVSSGDFSSIVEDNFSIASNVILNSLSDNNFELRLYILDNGEDQSHMMNKTFKGTISINVISRVKIDINNLGVDVLIRDIAIDGKKSESIPTKGYYDMTYTCEKGSNLTWEPISKTITYGEKRVSGDNCSLEFITNNSPKYVLLSEMPVGSYVAYIGKGGNVGNKNVYCKNGGTSMDNGEVESVYSCFGHNAREELDNSNYTYGYCSNSKYKYYTTGWRIAYKDVSDINNPKVILVSAGSPECNNMVLSHENADYIKLANSRALKYCNSDYVDGNCSCVDKDNDSLCDEASSDVWAISDNDFYHITREFSGFGKRLTDGSSIGLGDVGGSLGSKLFCYSNYSYRECGYNNGLIDIGGDYGFASKYSYSSDSGVIWDPAFRSVNISSDSYLIGLRPVIKLSSTVYVTGGVGTMDDPFTIGN